MTCTFYLSKNWALFRFVRFLKCQENAKLFYISGQWIIDIMLFLCYIVDSLAATLVYYIITFSIWYFSSFLVTLNGTLGSWIVDRGSPGRVQL